MTNIVKRTQSLKRAPRELPALGEWYWYEEELGCVTQVGSNYAELTFVENGKTRVHLDVFESKCRRELCHQARIQLRIQNEQHKINACMEEIKSITAELGVSSVSQLADGTKALVHAASSQPIENYKEALVKAHKEDLPNLFKKVKEYSANLACWLSADLIPLQAQADSLYPAIDKIEGQIFRVEIYAGLTESVVQIREGEPAPIDTKLHLFQRRHYMDEECLVNYEAGGMEFSDISEFDAWLVRPENLERLMPFQRCMLAFKVRRYGKHREFDDIAEYVNFSLSGEGDLDHETFLYMRNGEQVFRLSTKIKFEEKLFPDLDSQQMSGQLYAESFGASFSGRFITKHAYDVMVEEHLKKEATEKDEMRGIYIRGRHPERRYKLVSDESVYYDEMRGIIQKSMDAHNRLVLILQGLFDRSPVMHPHPQWKIYTDEGFHEALELVFDQDKATSKRIGLS